MADAWTEKKVADLEQRVAALEKALLVRTIPEPEPKPRATRRRS